MNGIIIMCMIMSHNILVVGIHVIEHILDIVVKHWQLAILDTLIEIRNANTSGRVNILDDDLEYLRTIHFNRSCHRVCPRKVPFLDHESIQGSFVIRFAIIPARTQR